jgi:hypothetical protein
MSVLATSLLDTNLSAHRARWGFAPALDVDGTRIRIESTTGPWPRVSLCAPDGRWLRVHSDRQPIDEAARLLTPTTSDAIAASLVCLVGAGYGYALDVLDSQASQTIKILAIEPEPAFLRVLLARRDWTPLINAGRLMVIAAPTYEGRTEAWRLVTPEAPDPPIILHPVIAPAREEAAREAVRIAAQALAGARANDEARRKFAGRYLLNTLRNLRHIANGADAGELSGRFAGVPAVLVGAGPSLDHTLPALRTLEDRTLVIAADTAWRPLVEAGIDPALVVTADPSELNGTHLIGVASRRETWLIAEGSVDPHALDASAGRVATFRVANHHPWPWLQTAGIQRPLVRVWGSVLTAAFDLAVMLGCDPIVFLGADLAYTDERLYCRGTTFEREWARHTAAGSSLRQIWRTSLAAYPTVMAPGVDGRDVLTAPRLLEFRNWLAARTTELTTRRFINATGAGTLVGPRIEQRDLQTALGDHPRRDPALRDVLRQVLRPAEARDVRPFTDAVLAAASIAARVDTEPVWPLGAEWVAFGRPTVTRGDIHDALTHGYRGLVASRDVSAPKASTEPVPEASPLRLHPADRAARLYSLLSGTTAGLDGSDPEGDLLAGRTAQSVRVEIVRIVDELLALHPLTTGSRDGVVSQTPLSWRFAWTDEAALLVAQLEEAMLAAASLRAADADTLSRGRDTFWAGPIHPVIDGDAQARTPASPLEHDLFARILLTREWLEASASEGEDATIASRSDRRLIEAACREMTNPHVHELAASDVQLELHGGRWSEACPLPIGAFMRVLTGTLAVSDAPLDRQTPTERLVRLTPREASGAIAGRIEPRLMFLDAPVSVVEPEVLTDRGFPRCWKCGGADGVATLTPYGARHSRRLFQDGHDEVGVDWPIEIAGEVPWGAKGGALAWSERESTLLLRSCDGADPLVEKVPFRPGEVAVGADGTAFCLALGGGLWEWLPGRPGRLLVDTPNAGSLYFEEDVLWLAPIVRNAQGQFVRRRGLDRLYYDFDHRALGHEACGPAGHETSVARHGAWTARTYGYSDMIGLRHEDGHSIALACYAPFRAAWCGPSLVVTTADGSVLFFRHLADHLAALRSR